MQIREQSTVYRDSHFSFPIFQPDCLQPEASQLVYDVHETEERFRAMIGKTRSSKYIYMKYSGQLWFPVYASV